ncbi:Unknown protein sequence [Pseudomonas coronafaciens pv. oryzae]|nr:Unknown protein sequence [Pseudomonas coronafaciens pv. oryzae]
MLAGLNQSEGCTVLLGQYRKKSLICSVEGKASSSRRLVDFQLCSCPNAMA